jgi:hypothetical protein
MRAKYSSGVVPVTPTNEPDYRVHVHVYWDPEAICIRKRNHKVRLESMCGMLRLGVRRDACFPLTVGVGGVNKDWIHLWFCSCPIMYSNLIHAVAGIRFRDCPLFSKYVPARDGHPRHPTGEFRPPTSLRITMKLPRYNSKRVYE